MSKLSPLAITGIAVGSLIGLGLLVKGYNVNKNLGKKNITYAETYRTAKRSIIDKLKGNTTKVNSPLKQGSSSVSDAISDAVSETASVFGSSSDSKSGGSRRKCKKGGKRKTKGRK